MAGKLSGCENGHVTHKTSTIEPEADAHLDFCPIAVLPDAGVLLVCALARKRQQVAGNQMPMLFTNSKSLWSALQDVPSRSGRQRSTRR
jgi:hypothetical protein